MIPNLPKLEGYMIYNPKLGLFSKGGQHVSNIWVKNGKIWRKMGHVKNHILQYCYWTYD